MAANTWQRRSSKTACIVGWNLRLGYHELVSRQLGANNNEDWFMNIVDLKNGISYILCSNASLQCLLRRVMTVEFTSIVTTASKAKRRKEIGARLLALEKQ